MKKQLTRVLFSCIIILSVGAFVFLNAENESFVLFEFNSEFPSFNVSSSTLPDVEAVKNTIILIKEIILFDL